VLSLGQDEDAWPEALLGMPRLPLFTGQASSATFGEGLRGSKLEITCCGSGLRIGATWPDDEGIIATPLIAIEASAGFELMVRFDDCAAAGAAS